MSLKKDVCLKCHTKNFILYFKEKPKKDDLALGIFETRWKNGMDIFGMSRTKPFVECPIGVIEDYFIKPLCKKIIEFMGKNKDIFSDENEIKAFVEIIGIGGGKWDTNRMIDIYQNPPFFCPYKSEH